MPQKQARTHPRTEPGSVADSRSRKPMYCNIEVLFDPGDRSFVFRATAARGFEVGEDGTVVMLEPLPLGDRALLRFTPKSTSGGPIEVAGVKLSGASKKEAEQRAPTIDTGDDWYYDTPFKVGNERADGVVRTLVLTDVHRESRFAGAWHYVFAVREPGGEPIWNDPKIYNKTPDPNLDC